MKPILIAVAATLLLLTATATYAQETCPNCQAKASQRAAAGPLVWRGPWGGVYAAPQRQTLPQVAIWGVPGHPVRNTWRAVFGPRVYLPLR